MELKPNDLVTLTIGSQAKVIKELGRGGQGIVYLVELAGQKMALKWYHNQPSDAFYKNLEHNVNAKAPSDAFIWPEYLTIKERGSFGYIMRLRPADYFEFGKFLLVRKKFKSLDAMFAAAMKICDGFMMLHRYGYSYQDLNDGNFFIRPSDGDVYSDRFSLSVILFLLFFVNHPFEGAKVVACPCMTEAFEKKFYGSEALFIYDKDDKSNLPVRGVHQNVIHRWPLFPSLLKDAFIEQFSQDKLKNPSSRMIEQDWKRIITKVRDELVICPQCHEETMVDTHAGRCKCINCGATIDTSKTLSIGTRNLILTPGTKLYIDEDNVPDGEVFLFPKDNKLLIIKNLAAAAWNVTTPGGKVKSVEPNEFMPVLNGLKISFGSGIKGAPGAKGEIKA